MTDRERTERQANADFAGALLGGISEHAVKPTAARIKARPAKPTARKSQCALIGRAPLDLLFHGAQAVDDQRGVKLMDGLADGALDARRRSRRLHVDRDAAGMLLLCIGLIDCGAERRTQISVANVAHDADDGDVVVRLVARALHDLAADGILRSSEEAFGSGKIDDGDLRLALCVCRGKFATHKDRLMNGGKVASGDARLLEVHVLIFGWLVSLD